MALLNSMQRLSESAWNKDTWGDSVWAAAKPQTFGSGSGGGTLGQNITASTQQMIPGAGTQIQQAPVKYGEPTTFNTANYQLPKVNIEGGGPMTIPYYEANDFQWNPEKTTNQWQWNQGSGGDSGGYSGYMDAMGNYQTSAPTEAEYNRIKADYEANQHLTQGDNGYWNPEWNVLRAGSYNPVTEKAHLGWAPGLDLTQKYGDLFGFKNFNNWRMEDGATENNFRVKLKSADKEGTIINYDKIGDKWVPSVVGNVGWDTNAAQRRRNLAFGAMATLAVGGALAAGGAFGGAGAGAAAGSGAGAGAGVGAGAGAIGSTVGQGTLSSLMAGGLQGGTALGGTLGGMTATGAAGTLGGTFGGLGMTGASTLAGGAGLGGLAATGASGTLGGTFGGLANIGASSLATGGSLGGLAGSGGAGMGSSLWDMAKEGYDLYSKGKRVYNTFNQLTQDPAQARPRTGMEGAGGGGFLSDLLRVGGGIYSDHQNRNAFEGLNDYFSRMEQERAPYQQKLTESYTNPNAYLTSPEYQALAAVRGNQLNRGAAKAGRLANDVDREVLMQQHAQKALGDYRSGLTNALNANRLPDQILRDAMERKGNAGGPTMGGIGASGILGNKNVQDMIAKYGPQAGSFIANIFSGSNYGNMPGLEDVDLSGAMDSWDESLMGGDSGFFNPSDWEWDNGDWLDSFDFGDWF
jgi:hypothetical protein